MLIMFLALAEPVFANGRISEEAEWASTIVAIIIVIAGGLISLLGVYIVSRRHRGSSDVAIKIGPKLEMKMTKLTQGVVIVLLGVIVLVVGLLYLPSNKTKRTVEGERILLDERGRVEEVKH